MSDSCTTRNPNQAPLLRNPITTRPLRQLQYPPMANVTKIHASKQPRRPHYIREWALKRGLRASQLAKELGADKSLISRWYSGATPNEEWQKRLAAFFDQEREALFRDPEDDWLYRFLRGRTKDEIEHIKISMETTFPRKTDPATKTPKKDGTHG